MTAPRLCGALCPWPREPHLEPIMWDGAGHGPRDQREVDRLFCLCGHPNYLTCPAWLSDATATGVGA